MASELYVETLKGLTSGANANKVIIPSGQTLDASAGSVELPAGVGGKVLQVVNNTSNSTSSTTASAELSAVSVNITPSSTSSKLLIIARAPFKIVDAQNAIAGWCGVRLKVDGSTIAPASTQDYEYGNNFGTNSWSDFRNVAFIQSLHSPSSTNQLTVEVKLVNYSGNQQLTANEDGIYFSSITVMEIAG